MTQIRMATQDDAQTIHAIYAPIVADTSISFEIDPPDRDEMAARIARTLATHPWLTGLLLEARDRGLRELEVIAAEAAPGTPFTAERLRVYLADRIRYRLAAREEAGLRRYLEMAATLPA